MRASWPFYTCEGAGDAQPRPSALSPLRCLVAALMPHGRGTQSRNRACSKLRRPGHPQSWVCPGSFTQSATSIKVSCPSRSEVVQFQRGFIEHTKIRPGQISSLSFPSPHLCPPHSIHITILPSSLSTCSPPALHASGPRIPFARACTVRVCVCVCLCACVRLHQLRQDQACQVGCFLFCASAPRPSTHLHRAERELEVQRARCKGHGRRLHAAHASQPSIQAATGSTSSSTSSSSRAIGLCCTAAHWDATRRPTTYRTRSVTVACLRDSLSVCLQADY